MTCVYTFTLAAYGVAAHAIIIIMIIKLLTTTDSSYIIIPAGIHNNIMSSILNMTLYIYAIDLYYYVHCM